MICVSERQQEKVESSIDVTDDGIVICERERQLLKASCPIDITEGGIVI